jgi:hypothetical protein
LKDIIGACSTLGTQGTRRIKELNETSGVLDEGTVHGLDLVLSCQELFVRVFQERVVTS